MASDEASPRHDGPLDQNLLSSSARCRSFDDRIVLRETAQAEEQIIGILKEQEAGANTQELCRRHGISGTTFFKWKAKFGGLEASDAKRLRSPEDENRRLKKLLAEQLLDNAALKDLVGKNF
jgi:putative transposase